METRTLGYTDLRLTTIGLGTWAIGGGGWAFAWGPQDDDDSIAAIRRALDLGINWIDTAPVYGFGHSEEIVGQAIRGRRDQVVLATKCGLRWKEGAYAPHRMLKAASVREEAENSLKRLQTDVIDLYQIHWPNPEGDIEEAWSVVADLIREGKVRYGGVSNFNVAQLRRLQAIHPVASLQPPYSMLARGLEGELMDYCVAHDIGLVVYSPMQAGLLTGRFTRARREQLPADDWRAKSPHFQDPQFEVNLQLVERLRPIAERLGASLAALSIAWTLRRPEVTSAIVGARKPSQIEETAGAGSLHLSEEDAAEIEALLSWRDEQLRAA